MRWDNELSSSTTSSTDPRPLARHDASVMNSNGTLSSSSSNDSGNVGRADESSAF
jgi:uncharacterized protein with WD repeat